MRMSQCNLDHTLDDVRKKYEAQRPFLPKETEAQFQKFFQTEHSQELLNEVFHLLKKYDLAEEEEQEHRLRQLLLIIQNVS